MMVVIPLKARTTLSLAVCIALANSLDLQANPYLDGLSPVARAEFKATPGLAAINAHYAYARGLDGRGESIGVFDTGVHPSHPEFGGRVTGIVAYGVDGAGNPAKQAVTSTGPTPAFSPMARVPT